MIITEGKQKIIEYFLNNNDIYLGLWSYQGASQINTFETHHLKYFELSDKQGYSRQKINKGNWYLKDSVENIYQSTEPVFFRTKEAWDNITGFFLITSLDDSGKLLSVIKFSSPEIVNISAFNHLYVSPTIQLL